MPTDNSYTSVPPQMPPVIPTPPAPPPHGIEVQVLASNKKSPKKGILFAVIALIMGLGITTGVFLVQRAQRLDTEAWDCSKYNFDVTREGVVTVTNNSTRQEPLQKATVSIDGSPAGVFDVPDLSPGDTHTLGTVSVPSADGFTWSVIGSLDCADSGSYDAPEPTVSPSPEPTLSPSPEPSVSPSPEPSVSPTVKPSVSPSPEPSITVVPSATPTLPPMSITPTKPTDPPPAPPNSCNGSCSSTANCTKGENGEQLICINNRCRSPQCTDQESCHCPPTFSTTVTPTPPSQLPQSGAVENTWMLGIGGLILLGFGVLLAL